MNFVWILKPVFGFITDTLFCCGARRKPYLIGASLVGIVGWILMGSLTTTLWMAVLTKTIINISTGFVNVIGEGVMVENSQTKSEPK